MTAMLALLFAGCVTMAELQPPAQKPGPPEPEAPPDTFVASVASFADTDPSALADFRPVLARFGTWVDDEQLGTVWVPSPRRVGPDFVPFVSAGHWAYGDDYVWASDYEWGWLPFHYGRWVWSDARRWVWIPGRAYAPAWVVWRTGPARLGYVGWAPAPPAFVWRSRVAVATTRDIEASFVFCPSSNLFSKNLSRWIVAREAGFALAKRTDPYVRPYPAPDDPLGSVSEHGPTPGELGVRVVTSNLSLADRDALQHALSYALPQTIPHGAHPPSAHSVRMAPPVRLPRPSAPNTYTLTY